MHEIGPKKCKQASFQRSKILFEKFCIYKSMPNCSLCRSNGRFGTGQSLYVSLNAKIEVWSAALQILPHDQREDAAQGQESLNSDSFMPCNLTNILTLTSRMRSLRNCPFTIGTLINDSSPYSAISFTGLQQFVKRSGEPLPIVPTSHYIYCNLSGARWCPALLASIQMLTRRFVVPLMSLPDQNWDASFWSNISCCLDYHTGLLAAI